MIRDMNARFLISLLIVTVALSGCAFLEDDDPVEADERVEFPFNAVVDEEMAVTVEVENLDDTEGPYEVSLRANGDELDTESLTLEEGEQTTLRLSHTFEEPGEYTLAVGEAEQSIRVFETPTELFHETDFDRETRVSEQEHTFEGEIMETREDTISFQGEGTETVRENFTAETKYRLEESTFFMAGFEVSETTEEWIIDGTSYTKVTEHATDEVTYDSAPSDEFDDETDFSADAIVEHTSSDHTDDEYVFLIDPPTSEAATAVWDAFEDDPDDELGPAHVTDLFIEFRIDRQTAAPAGAQFDVTFEEVDELVFFEMSIEVDIVSHNETVTVELPADVEEALHE